LFAEAELNMTAEQVGIQFFYIGIIAVVIQGFLIKPLTNALCRGETVYDRQHHYGDRPGPHPFAHNMLTLALFLGLMAVGKSLNTPTITSLISKRRMMTMWAP
jgi:MFS transporter, DHA1 family, tetracycline resistance protein